MLRVLVVLAFATLALCGHQRFMDGPAHINDLMQWQFEIPQCVQLADINGPLGCATSTGGAVAPMYVVDNVDKFAAAPPDEKVVVVMDASLFTGTTLHSLAFTRVVAGIVITDDGTGNSIPVGGFSADAPYPNVRWGLHPDSSHVWNTQAVSTIFPNGLAFDAFPFPVAAADVCTSTYLLCRGSPHEIGSFKNKTQCANYLATCERRLAAQTKAAYPRPTISLNDWMQTGGRDGRFSSTSHECLRTGTCAPLGGQSVWASVGPLQPTKPVVFATAAIDSNAFFHDMGFGVHAELSGMLAQLLALDALTAAFPFTHWLGLPRQIVFVFFNGESYGYMGSRRFVDDLVRCNNHSTSQVSEADDKYCKALPAAFLSLSTLSADSVIHASQLAGTTSPHFVHTELSSSVASSPTPLNSDTLSLALLLANSTALAINPAWSSQPTPPGLPPTSPHTFLRYFGGLPAVVLADHGATFLPLNYHSRYDRYGDELDTPTLCSAATALARALYARAAGVALSDAALASITANCTLAQSLLNTTATSPQADSAGGSEASSHFWSSRYVSVYSWGSVPAHVYQLFNLVMSATAYTSASPPTPCKKDKQCRAVDDEFPLCLDGRCVAHTAAFHDALSLAFVYDPLGGLLQTGQWHVVNASEPCYTESYWDGSPTIKFYYAANPDDEFIFLVVSLGLFVAWFAAVGALVRWIGISSYFEELRKASRKKRT